MAESEGASQKKRQGGFGLFKPSQSSRRSRRRSGSSPTSLPSASQPLPPPYSSTLDLPDFRNPGTRSTTSMGTPNSRKKRSNPFGWLFGNRADRRSQRTQTRSGNSSLSGVLPPNLSRDRDSGSSRRSAPGGRPMSRITPPALPTLADPTNQPDRRLVPFPQPASRSELMARRRRRSPKSPSPRTQLQVANPTMMQQPTTIQQATSLQSSEAIPEPLFVKPGKGADRRALLRPKSRSTAIALYIARMLILSIGVGVLAGTVLSAWNPGNTLFLADVSRQPAKQIESPAPSPQAHSAQLALTTEITPLKAKLQSLIQQSTGFAPALFLIDLDNFNYVDVSGSAALPSASLIKVPILIAFFQDVDAGKIRLDDKLTMTKEMIAQGSGDMQSMPPGTQFTALETATQMIIVSDNTATNMLIARLGGIAALNERFKSWGLTATSLKNMLPDLEGTNMTNPRELANLMVRVSQGELVSMRSRDRMLSIMQRTVNNSQLPQGLGEGATISHKTGDIGALIGDVGLIDMPNGKRYAAAVMVKRPFNDDRAYEVVQKISSVIYQHLQGVAQPGRSTNPTPYPSPTSSASPGAEEQGVETDALYNQDGRHQNSNDAEYTPDSELNPADSPPQEPNPDQASRQ